MSGSNVFRSIMAELKIQQVHAELDHEVEEARADLRRQQRRASGAEDRLDRALRELSAFDAAQAEAEELYRQANPSFAPGESFTVQREEITEIDGLTDAVAAAKANDLKFGPGGTEEQQPDCGDLQFPVPVSRRTCTCELCQNYRDQSHDLTGGM